ncbi:MAG TPA: immunoglobulin domain-containing protein [Verrucomicrobiota bacterium]|nr:immunoglobulin domain-containing protein [Verrucomicrobiota bacterium]
MKPTLALVAFVFATTLSTQINAQTVITDPFTSASAWDTPLTESGKNISVGSGRLDFTSSNTSGGTAALPRITPLLTTTQHWSVQVEAHLDDFTITSGAQSVSLFLGVGKTGNWLDTHVLLGFDRDDNLPDSFGMNDDFSVNGSSIPGFFNVNSLPSGDVAMRLEYNATAKTLAFLYDTNGATGGYSWTQLGLTNIASGTYNLQLGPTDTFTILLAGWANLQTVTSGQAYFDNLEITITPVEYAPASIAGIAVLGVITNTEGVAMYAVVTNTYDVTTFSLLGPDADYNYNGNYTYVKTGPNTATIYTIKTAPPEQAGETGTNYLTFTSATNGLFVYNWPLGGGGYGTQLGTFQIMAAAPVGSLQVTISPSGAVSDGAHWQVDGGAWQNSGSTVSNLTVGNHTLSYKSVAGWNTPENQTVAIAANTTTATNGTYVAQTGSLQVTISPAGAVSAGAQWQVDGGAWQNNSSTVSNLTIGSHTVSYKSVADWNTPSNQTVAIVANTTTMTNGVYVAQTGSLLVTIDPIDAITAGAQWQVDGGPWQNSGTLVSGLSTGTHWITFNSIPDWFAPSSQLVVVAPNATTIANGLYVPSGGPVPPPLINCLLQGDTFSMSFLAVPGPAHILQYTTNLTPPVTWRPVLPFMEWQSPITLVIPTDGVPTRFFRVRVGDDAWPAVYSVNVVGYVRRTMHPGLNLVANPLNSCGGNSIANLFPDCPQSSGILLPDSNGSLNPGSTFSGGSWDPPNLNVSPGQGIGFVNPGPAFEVTFAGEVAGNPLINPLPQGFSLVGSILPVNGLLNFPAQQGDEITTWNATNQSPVNHGYFGGAWQPAPPAISPGEAFWVQISQSQQWTQPFDWWNDLEVWEFPIITRQPQNQTRNPGEVAHFTASALGGYPLSYQWRRNGTNVSDSIRVFGTDSPTLAITNAQSGDAGNYSVVITNSFGSVTSQVAVLTISMPAPEIITTNGSFGISNGVFGFNLTGLSGQTVVMEAATNLANPIWVPLQTNTLDGDTFYFSDPQWTNYRGRFYRIRTP